MPRSDNNSNHSQSNSVKLDGLAVSLDFLKREVATLNKDQKAIRLMLLEIMENTKQYEFPEAPKEQEQPVPVKSSWFWSS